METLEYLRTQAPPNLQITHSIARTYGQGSIARIEKVSMNVPATCDGMSSCPLLMWNYISKVTLYPFEPGCSRFSVAVMAGIYLNPISFISFLAYILFTRLGILSIAKTWAKLRRKLFGDETWEHSFHLIFIWAISFLYPMQHWFTKALFFAEPSLFRNFPG